MKEEEKDIRLCALCSVVGDCLPSNEGRLMYVGGEEWVHINCGLWSAETYENEDGTLMNIHTAINRGRKLVGSLLLSTFLLLNPL
jgi:histone-lysine N-methyltransferase MLL1